MAEPTERDWEMARDVCRDVAELPERTSPLDNTDYMLVTANELAPMVAYAIAAASEEGRREEREEHDRLIAIIERIDELASDFTAGALGRAIRVRCAEAMRRPIP